MARLVGYGGDLLAPGIIAGIRAWNIDSVANVQDTSGYDTDQPKTFTVTQTEWSGSFEGFKQDGVGPLAVGASLAAEFHESAVGTQKWTGTVLITGVRPTSSVDGVVLYAYDFQGTAVLTAATT